jgi:hypothetical protein
MVLCVSVCRTVCVGGNDAPEPRNPINMMPIALVFDVESKLVAKIIYHQTTGSNTNNNNTMLTRLLEVCL